jgi:DNA invertase Pin-like site-specific DNA recombinase
MKKYVSYVRVSTTGQGESGLGLEAQRSAVAKHIADYGGEEIAWFKEIESGKRSDRPQLEKAIRRAKKEKATLLVAKLDRLARNVHFITSLQEKKIKFVAADMPGVNNFTVHIMAAVAEQEAEAISTRTKAALAAAKKRGVVLGGRRPVTLEGGGISKERLVEVGATARAKRSAKVSAQRAELRKHIERIRKTGVTSLRAIAATLNDEGEIETPRGGEWTATQVQRVLART